MGKIVMTMAFQLGVAASGGGSSTQQMVVYSSLLPGFILPILLKIFYDLRRKTTKRLLDNCEEKRQAIIDSSEDITSNFRLVVDYYKRPLVVQDFVTRVKAFNRAGALSTAVRVNNEAFPAYLGLAVTFTWVVIGGLAVRNPNVMLPLGTFLAVLSVFGAISAEYKSIFGHIIVMQTTFPSLWLTVGFMNLPTDCEQRMVSARAGSKAGLERLKTMRQTMKAAPQMGAGKLNPFPIDEMELKITIPEYTFEDGEDEKGEVVRRRVLQNVRLTIPQGTLVGVTGRRERPRSNAVS